MKDNDEQNSTIPSIEGIVWSGSWKFWKEGDAVVGSEARHVNNGRSFEDL